MMKAHEFDVSVISIYRVYTINRRIVFIIEGVEWTVSKMMKEEPEEIKKLRKIYEPYLVGCHLENAPQEAIDALEKVRKWDFEQGQ